MKISIIVFLIFLTTGCATTLNEKAETLAEADANQVSKCKFLGDVQGSKFSGLAFAESGLKDAKNEVKNNAADLGATHIVWGSISTGATQFASAKAYNCN